MMLTGGGESSSKSKGGKKAAAAAASSSDSHLNFTTEYAKSGKSKCRGCEDFIAKVRPCLFLLIQTCFIKAGVK